MPRQSVKAKGLAIGYSCIITCFNLLNTFRLIQTKDARWIPGTKLRYAASPVLHHWI